VTETDVENRPGGSGLTYQDEDSTEVPVQAKETNVQTRLRRDQKHVLLDAAVVEKFKKRRAEVAGHDNEDDEQNMDDPTMTQYCSGNEENGTARPVPRFNIEDMNIKVSLLSLLSLLVFLTIASVSLLLG
jgi:hypothetical protein